jgi:DNA-binding CsgD family transcriptional regulator/antitoxin (DNA-binding transcriptional repressor) of toxin-antitoxin stability system
MPDSGRPAGRPVLVALPAPPGPRGILGDVTARQPTSPFVGREPELDTLSTALRAVAAGEPAVLVVGGEAGVGKTRLLEEFAARARLGGARVLAGGCVELGEDGLPFAPVVAALRGLLRDAEPGIEELLAPARDDLARLLPELGRRLPDGPWPGNRGRLFEVLLDLLERLGRQQPLVLLLEDLHWADRSTREFVGVVARSIRDTSVLLVLSFRSDELHRGHPLRPFLAELGRVRGVDRLELPRFGRAEVAALLAGLLGRTPAPVLLDDVLRRSEGNAFFVELLVGGGDGDGLCDLSDSIRDLLLARVERLSAPTQQVLRIASGGGRRIDYPLLAAVADLPEADLLAALREAVSSHVLVADVQTDRRTAGGDGFAFRHSLVREAVHDDLLPGEHARLHVRYAETLQARPGLVPPERYAAELAHHWYAAHDAEQALPAAVAAAEVAGSVFAHAEQRRLLERALELWDRVPDAAAVTGLDHLGLLERTVQAGVRAGDHERALALVSAAIAEADAGGEPPERRALLFVTQAKLLRGLGRTGGIAELRATALVLPAGSAPAARARVLDALGCALMLKPVPEESLRVSGEALRLAREVGDRATEISALVTIGCNRVLVGDPEAGAAELAEALALAEELGDGETLTRVHNDLADSLTGLGRYEEAATVARAGVELARRLGYTRTCGILIGNLAEALTALGRWSEASRLIDEALDLDPPGLGAVFLRQLRADLALARGQEATAGHELSAARAVLSRSYVGAESHLPLVRLEAALHARQGDAAAVLETVESALAAVPARAVPRYVLPLLALAAAVAADLAGRGRALREDDLVADARAAARWIRGQTAELPIRTAVSEAWARLVSAELARCDGGAPAEWERAVAGWRAVGQPYPLAYALFRLAEAEAAAGADRQRAGDALREAFGLGSRLEAHPLVEEIERLARRARLDPGVAVPSPRGQPQLGLTPREREVLRGVAAGRSNRQIAEELFITAKTVSVHVSNILTKLEVSGRGEAAAAAHRLRLFDGEPLAG